MSEKPKKCPLCITKLKVRGNELYCPECGYKYCDHSYSDADIFNNADHYHDTHTTYSTDPTLDSTQDPTLYATQGFVQDPFTTTNTSISRSIPTPNPAPVTRSTPIISSGPRPLSKGRRTPGGSLFSVLLIFGVIAFFIFEVWTETDMPELIDELTQNAKETTEFNLAGHGTDSSSDQAVEHLIAGIAEANGIERKQVIEDLQYLYVYPDSNGNLFWSYYLNSGTAASYQSEDTNFQISDLAQFTNLYALYVPEVILKKGELDPFTNLTCLECSNTPEELTKIIDPKKITYLILHDRRNSLRTLNKLDQFTNLCYLNVQSTTITDLSALSSCSGLIELDLYTPRYTGSYNFLQGMPGLMGLSLQTDWLVTLDFCKNCPNLHNLHIYSYKDAAGLLLTGIDNLQNLEELYISNISVKEVSLSELSKLPNLTYLSLPYCKLTDVSLLKDCKNLNTLVLQGNHLDEFSDLPALPNLYQVDLSYNYLKEMPDDTSAWPRLNTIDISGNTIPAEKVQSFITVHPEIVVNYVKEQD